MTFSGKRRAATELDYTEQTSWILFLKYLDDLEVERGNLAELGNKPYERIIEGEYRWAYWPAPKKTDGTFDHDKALTGDDLIAFVDRKLFPYLPGFKARVEGPNTIEYKIGEIFGEVKNRFQSGYSLRDALELFDQLKFRSQTEKHELSQLYGKKIKRLGNAGRNGGEYYTPRPLIRAIIKVKHPYPLGGGVQQLFCIGNGFLKPQTDRVVSKISLAAFHFGNLLRAELDPCPKASMLLLPPLPKHHDFRRRVLSLPVRPIPHTSSYRQPWLAWLWPCLRSSGLSLGSCWQMRETKKRRVQQRRSKVSSWFSSV